MFAVAAAAATALAGVSACADEPGPGSVSPSATAPSTVVSTTAARSPSAAPTASVTVALSASAYAVGETVRLTVGNGLREPIYTEDFQTQCTIVTLQKSEAGSWTDITGCAMGRPTRTVTVQPGATKRILLDPHGFHLAEGPNELGFGQGTYRIRFGYRLSPELIRAQPEVVYSSTFTVG
jgi:hypothetical protein